MIVRSVSGSLYKYNSDDIILHLSKIVFFHVVVLYIKMIIFVNINGCLYVNVSLVSGIKH